MAGDAALRRAANRRDGAAPRQDRRDADGGGEDAGRDAGGLPERTGGRRRPPGDGERLSGEARRTLDGRDLPGAGNERGGAAAQLSVPVRPRLRAGRGGRGGGRGQRWEGEQRRSQGGQRGGAREARATRRYALPAAGDPPGGLRGRDHVWHQQRVWLRLPAGQHGDRGGAAGTAAAGLRDRGRGRQHPDRRGAHAADYQRPRRGELGRVPHVLADRAAAQGGRGPDDGAEVAVGVAHGGRDRESGDGAGDRQPLRRRERAPDAVLGGGAAGAVRLPPRPRLRGA